MTVLSGLRKSRLVMRTRRPIQAKFIFVTGGPNNDSWPWCYMPQDDRRGRVPNSGMRWYDLIIFFHTWLIAVLSGIWDCLSSQQVVIDNKTPMIPNVKVAWQSQPTLVVYLCQPGGKIVSDSVYCHGPQIWTLNPGFGWQINSIPEIVRSVQLIIWWDGHKVFHSWKYTTQLRQNLLKSG